MAEWPLRLVPRPAPSTLMRWAASPLAALAMLLTGIVFFGALGKDPLAGFRAFFIEPLNSLYGLGELLLTATPLLLCGLGLGLGYRANVWNIGAEGQFTIGAITGAGLGLFLGARLGPAAVPLMLAAGVLGGMAWAAIPAFLRTRFNTSEIFVSLMLVYIAQLLLAWLVHGPWRDPAGNNFPQSAPLPDAATLHPLLAGARVTMAFPLALLLALVSWWFSTATAAGFRMRVGGLAPAAAAYAGIGDRRNVWMAMLISGATAGLAGVCEVAGPIGMLQPTLSPGYGFTAIIVVFVGRLHPLGIVLASLLMSALYLGGQNAQLELQLPASVSGLFQGVLLFYLLAAELFIRFRLCWVSPGMRRPEAGR
ncbi:MAG TPA: ABC transporter permease [Steroidobacteraceae bacterium]|nr:ABC transporter permease [Steroidobacteraceae bacterium]